MNELTIVDNKIIQDKIYSIRGAQVMLDRDLGELYGVQTSIKIINTFGILKHFEMMGKLR